MIKDVLIAHFKAKRVYLEHFVYVAEWNTLGASTTSLVNIQLQNDSDFLAEEITISSYSSAGTQVTNPDYLITIFGTASGRQYQSAAAHVWGMCGTAQWPMKLPTPLMLDGGTTLAVTLQNLTAVSARVHVHFIGTKVFYLRGFSRGDLLG